jgi:hypothetical protein
VCECPALNGVFVTAFPGRLGAPLMETDTALSLMEDTATPSESLQLGLI